MFAVPGEITSALSKGSNALLRLGATPLTSVDDVLESLGVEPAPPRGPDPGGAAATLLHRLRDSRAGADELVRATGLGAGEVAAALAELELAGLAEERDGVYRASG